MKTFKFSLVLRTRENTDVFITLENIYGIHHKRVNILYIFDVSNLPSRWNLWNVKPCVIWKNWAQLFLALLA